MHAESHKFRFVKQSSFAANSSTIDGIIHCAIAKEAMLKKK